MVKMPSGRYNPVNVREADPTPGSVAVNPETGGGIALKGEHMELTEEWAAQGVTFHLSHFADCPKAEEFRKASSGEGRGDSAATESPDPASGGGPRCAFCGESIDPTGYGVFHKVEGWAPRREKGGANSIALSRPLGEVVHHACLEKMKQGINPGQEKLV